MKRTIISLLLVVMLCMSLAISASAAYVDFIIDSQDVLTDDERTSLNDMAAEIFEDTGVGVYYVYVYGSASVTDYNVHGLVREVTDDYYVMVENDDSWYYFAGGTGEQLDTDALREAYDNTETYAEGVEAYLAEASLQLTFLDDGSEDGEPAEDNLLVWDEAELLNETEVAQLNSKLESISKKYKAEIRVVTLSSMDGGDIDEFLEYLYDESGFGYGENHDGVLLVVCMDPREYRILSNGFAGEAITSGDIDAIGEAFKSDLSDGNYADAFDTFADKCEYYLDGHINGFPFNTGKNLLICLGIGLVVALIVTGIWKGQLKSVRKQSAANAYVKAGTMQITQSGDFFMYRNVTKTQKQSSSSSGSSGSSRSTGGGSF
ncbi:MAG: TPM domain-containing protein [Oscillospiraceae bacterium]|jgi:uncharacterized protein|nr:TPM domain-containing protein [Oscillospiraceae bacterium]